MKSPLRSGIVALIAIAFCTANSWAARTSGARLTIADNKVSIAGKPAASGTTIAPGDTITTGSRSRAELTLPDGTVVRIGQGSSFTYTGSKLVLNQGTALVHATHKGTTVVSGSRSYTGGPAVVSAEVSKKTDGLYILQGSGKVNGAPLIAGQTSVLDRGKDRTFTFDLQKMVGSSALVTKFPQTPWVSQTQVLAGVQHQLLTAKVTPAGKPGAPLASHDIVSSKVANLVSTGAAGTSLAGRAGSPGSPGGGALQLLAGPLSLGADKVAVIKSAAISSFTNGGTLQVSGSIISANNSASGVVVTAGIVKSGSGNLAVNNTNLGAQFTAAGGSTLTLTENVTAAGGATLNLTGRTLNTGGNSGVVNAMAVNTLTTSNLGNFTLNGIIASGGVSSGSIVKNSFGTIVPSTVGVLNFSGANTFTGSTTVNPVTLTVNNGGVTTGSAGVINLTNPNLTFTGTGTIGTIQNVNAGTLTVNNGGSLTGGSYPLVNATGSPGTLTVVNGGAINVNGVQTTVAPGQTLNFGGVIYTVTQPSLDSGRLILQPAAH